MTAVAGTFPAMASGTRGLSPLALLLALVLHVAFLGLVVLGFHLTPPMHAAPKTDAIQAHLVDASSLHAEQQRRAREQAERAAQRQAAEQAARLQRQEQQRREQAQEQQRREQEQKRHQQSAQQQRQQTEAQRAAQEAARARAEQQRQAQQAQAQHQKQVAEERQRQQDAIALKKREDEQQRKAQAIEQKRVAEQQRIEAVQRQEEQKRQAEAEVVKRKEDEEKRRLAQIEARRQAEELRRRQAEIAQEEVVMQQRMAQTQAEQRVQTANATVERYTGLIKDRVKRNWLRPSSAARGMECEIRVRLTPGGEVVGVSIRRSSGDPAFDRSAEAAVFKGSPLPVPKEVVLFEDNFREFTFTFKPEE